MVKLEQASLKKRLRGEKPSPMQPSSGFSASRGGYWVNQLFTGHPSRLKETQNGPAIGKLCTTCRKRGQLCKCPPKVTLQFKQLFKNLLADIEIPSHFRRPCSICNDRINIEARTTIRKDKVVHAKCVKIGQNERPALT